MLSIREKWCSEKANGKQTKIRKKRKESIKYDKFIVLYHDTSNFNLKQLNSIMYVSKIIKISINPFTPGDFAEKCVLKLVEWFSGHYRAIKS